jgi:hypothetical protein
MLTKHPRTGGLRMTQQSPNIINLDSDDDEDITTAVDIDEQRAKSPVVIDGSLSVFQTFETDAKLQAGLCIIRPLGGGKYEIINMSRVNQEDISSKETGTLVNGNEPRFKAMNVSKEQWDTAAFKCGQVILSSSKITCPMLLLPCEREG